MYASCVLMIAPPRPIAGLNGADNPQGFAPGLHRCTSPEADHGISYHLAATRRRLLRRVAISNHSNDELFDRRERLSLEFLHHDFLEHQGAAPLRRVPHQTIDKSKWPSTVRPISTSEGDGLGIDVDGRLYWNGKPVEIIGRRLDLTKNQTAVALVLWCSRRWRRLVP